MDWEKLARTFERVTDARGNAGGERFEDMFAPGGTYQDPVNPPMSDFGEMHKQTESATPDWHCEITAICGEERFGAMEWTGRATLFGVAPFVLAGCAFIEVDADGKVVRWRDYFDIDSIAQQTKEAFSGASAPTQQGSTVPIAGT